MGIVTPVIVTRQFIKPIVLLAVSFFFVGCTTQAAKDASKPHHTRAGFRNVYISDSRGFLDFWKWRWDRLWKKIPTREAYHFPLARNDPNFLRTNQDKTTLTWIGHATVFLQLGGKNILTDPHFAERASPVQWAGPKRAVAPGVPLDDLPAIDIVIISHDHYDSLDETTIGMLMRRTNGEKTHFFVPLGLKPWFQSLGIQKVTELDWWDEYREDPLTMIAVPVQHWSKRGLFDRNNTLWAGWVIQSNNFRFFFSGDSGYTPHFDEIGRRFGPFDLSAIPIGAYEPRWFMRRYHISPEEAVQVHMDIRSRKSVAIHWGTFILTDEPLDEPPERLRKARQDKGLSPDDFLLLEHGETLSLQSPPGATMMSSQKTQPQSLK